MPKWVWQITILPVLLWSALLAQAETKEVKIGAILGLSGPLAAASQDLRDSALWAAEDLNAKGNLKLKLLTEDSQWDSRQAVSAFHKLVNTDQVKFIYTVGSTITLALKPLSEARQILLFSTATHPKITMDSRLAFRHSNFVEKDAPGLAESVAKFGASRVAMISVQDEWSSAYAKFFSQRYKELTSKGEIFSVEVLPQETDFRSVLAKLRQNNPQALAIMTIGSQNNLILQRVTELKFPAKVFFSNTMVLTPDALALIKSKNLCDFYYQDYALPNSQYLSGFEKRFARKPSSFAVIGYSDMELLHAAISKAGQDALKAAVWIKQLGSFKGRFEDLTILPSGEIWIKTEVKYWACHTK
jgi:branched-chain amino acid transport system substrate-binding protein